MHPTGPDNLWALSDDRHAVIELKTGCSTETIATSDLDQLGGSVRWEPRNRVRELELGQVVLHALLRQRAGGGAAVVGEEPHPRGRDIGVHPVTALRAPERDPRSYAVDRCPRPAASHVVPGRVQPAPLRVHGGECHRSPSPPGGPAPRTTDRAAGPLGGSAGRPVPQCRHPAADAARATPTRRQQRKIRRWAERQQGSGNARATGGEPVGSQVRQAAALVGPAPRTDRKPGNEAGRDQASSTAGGTWPQSSMPCSGTPLRNMRSASRACTAWSRTPRNHVLVSVRCWNARTNPQDIGTPRYASAALSRAGSSTVPSLAEHHACA
ncbi:hypothetical protein B6264_25790 [Kitasatospora aureofaciens]|nr:hypothetical protein B6264_25790 [Kitasatospora aureofaciens]